MIDIDRAKVIGRSGGHLKFWCPGCVEAHVVRIAPTPSPWEWNGDTQRPTLSPSVLVNPGRANPASHVCHSFVRDGYIEFLSDCSHELAGQTVELGACSPD